MTQYDWSWLVWTMVLVFGVSIQLTAIGFAVEETKHKNKNLLLLLEFKKYSIVLAVGATLFTIGLYFLGSNLLQMISATGFTLLMYYLVWRS